MAPPEAPRELVQHGRFDSPFFRSKFRVPSIPPHFVERDRLGQLLDDLAEYPVTALIAPAGAGKTALAADWATRNRPRGAWLTLDTSDRDPRQLLTAIATALEPLAPGCAQPTVATLRERADPLDAAYALIDALERAEPEFGVLVIDDVHRIDEDAAAAAIFESFVEHRPAWLSLVLLSRRQLPLPVDRLRAGGLLADITFDALRFSHTEAMQMLTATCPDIAPEDLTPVAEWADGWAAALQLAALALRSRSRQVAAAALAMDERSAVSDRLVDSYLWHEVLRAERPEMISILLSVAVVGRVNYSLAEAVTGRPDAGQLLAEAETRGLFVSKLESGGWFEVHGLVRDMLVTELERRWPQRLEELHLRAARWFESAGDTVSALDHWLAGHQPREALRLLCESAVELHESGRGSAIRRIIDQIPRPSPGTDPEALIEYAWCKLPLDREEFASALRGAEVACAADPEPNGRLLILRAVAALLSGDWAEAEEHAVAALDAFGGRPWVDGLGRFGWSLVADAVALDERWDHAEPTVRLAQLGVNNDAERLVSMEGTRAIGLALAGHPLEAMQTAAGVNHVAAEADMGTLRSVLVLAEALAARELGDRVHAREVLDRFARESSYPHPFIQVVAQLELVELELSSGHLAAADEAFRLATETCERDTPGRGTGSWLARNGVLLALAHGDHEGARRWSERIEDSFWRPVSDARVHLSAGRTAEAAEVLASCLPRNAKHRVVVHLLLARATRADRDSAEKQVATALELASEEGMLQTVGSEGHGVLDLIELAAWRVPDGWMDRLRRVVVHEGPSVRVATHAMVEELTARELEVLRLLPTRLTVREIATELFVSHNTLKFHLRVIYQKLGVNSRADAVSEARSYGLLGHS